MVEPLVIAGTTVLPGERASLRIPVARHTTHAEAFLPVQVVRGVREGPRLFVCAALHGDEINGVEIVRRLFRLRALARLRGALIAVPVVNVFGFTGRSRYLPDRRDLNRSFPGSPSGSLAARLAHLLMQEVVANASHGLDLHTGALHRENLPQVRAGLADPETRRLALAFGAPVVLDADVRDGSLRQAVRAHGLPLLVYEAGEALRFDEVSIRAGVRGAVAVMRALRMLPEARTPRRRVEPMVAHSSTWLRAPESGILRSDVRLGSRVRKEQPLGSVSDPLGDGVVPLVAPADGVVIGRTTLPLVHEGDAVFHVASFASPRTAAEKVEAFRAAFLEDDEPAPIEGDPGGGAPPAG